MTHAVAPAAPSPRELADAWIYLDRSPQRPTDFEDVLVLAPANEHPIWIGWHDGDFDSWYGQDDVYYEDGEVAAWMPLTDLMPKEYRR